MTYRIKLIVVQADQTQPRMAAGRAPDFALPRTILNDDLDHLVEVLAAPLVDVLDSNALFGRQVVSVDRVDRLGRSVPEKTTEGR